MQKGMGGDNRAAVAWVTRCVGAKCERVCLLMRMVGRLELAGGWKHTAEHIALQNILADGFSRCHRSIVADKVRKQTNFSDWYEQDIGTRRLGIFDFMLHTKDISSQQNDMLWNLVKNEAEHG